VFPLLAALLVSGCASKADRTAGATNSTVNQEVAAALQEEGTIEFFDHAWTSSTIQAEVLAQVFEKLGGDASVKTAAHVDSAFVTLSKDPDVFDPEVWTILWEPQIEQYVERDKTVEIFYESELTAEEGWYVPTYVIEGDAERGIEPTCPGLPDWQALNDCADVFATAKTAPKGQYTSGAKEWGPYYGDPQRIENLGLDYQIEYAGSEAALMAEWRRAYEQGEPFLGLMWTPTYTGLKYDVTRVEFPPYSEDCWGSTFACNWDNIEILGLSSPEFREAHPTGSKILDKYDLNDEQLLDIMTRVEEKGLTPKDAVAEWIEENPEVWQAWAS